MAYKYKGEDISEEFVVEGFENSSFTILDDYISNTDGLEVVEEKVGKTSDVAAKGATVTSSPGQASENMELKQVDTSLVLEDPKPRFIELESGNIVYEDTYLKTKAGKKGGRIVKGKKTAVRKGAAKRGFGRAYKGGK